jgi:hypothetical protein
MKSPQNGTGPRHFTASPRSHCPTGAGNRHGARRPRYARRLGLGMDVAGVRPGQPNSSDRVRGQQLRSNCARLCAGLAESRGQCHGRFPAPDRTRGETGRTVDGGRSGSHPTSHLVGFHLGGPIRRGRAASEIAGPEVLSSKMETPPYDLKAAFRSFADAAANMLLLLSGPFFALQRGELIELSCSNDYPRCSSSSLMSKPAG